VNRKLRGPKEHWTPEFLWVRRTWTLFSDTPCYVVGTFIVTSLGQERLACWPTFWHRTLSLLLCSVQRDARRMEW